MVEMHTQLAVDAVAPSWIWRGSKYGKLGIDERELLSSVIERDDVPETMAQCFRLNIAGLLERVRALPWGPGLWACVYAFAEQIAEACILQPARKALH